MGVAGRGLAARTAATNPEPLALEEISCSLPTARFDRVFVWLDLGRVRGVFGGCTRRRLPIPAIVPSAPPAPSPAPRLVPLAATQAAPAMIMIMMMMMIIIIMITITIKTAMIIVMMMITITITYMIMIIYMIMILMIASHNDDSQPGQVPPGPNESATSSLRAAPFLSSSPPSASSRSSRQAGSHGLDPQSMPALCSREARCDVV